ncbi:hypothetical protein ACRQ5Q_22370 [Bradyrhizobium sp. PMVTL-01]|uniref:hypothetical protein n=1 Tax=Bradyrhizobium sp. PMVTL-01 TaxID=3434999 RepID=UPI003F6EA333
MRALNNSETAGFKAKRAELGSEEYSARVAQPVMNAIDSMPLAYRELLNEFGYVDVYRAWKRGWSPQMIRDRVANGTFDLNAWT